MRSRSSRVKRNQKDKPRFLSRCFNWLNRLTRRDVLSNLGRMMMMMKKKKILLTRITKMNWCIELMIWEMRMIQGLISPSWPTRRRRLLGLSKHLGFLTNRNSRRLCRLIKHSLHLTFLKKMMSFLRMRLLKEKLNLIICDTRA